MQTFAQWSVRHRWWVISGWVLLVLVVAYLASVVLLFRESGEKLPQANSNKGGTTPPNTPPAA